MSISEHEQRLRELVRVFLEENAKLNLSALRSEEQCWIGNVLDSLALLDVLPSLRPSASSLRIADVGTGGGFPLLPLAICLPDASLFGIDATQKKIDAVGRIRDRLGLTNVTLIAGRAEELGHRKEWRETCDLVTARAVAPIHTLLEYCSPFAKPGGHVVLWKSLHIDQELTDSLLARAELSTHLVKQHEYDLPGDWGRRQLLIFEKAAALPSKYPRAVGIPKKDPIV